MAEMNLPRSDYPDPPVSQGPGWKDSCDKVNDSETDLDPTRMQAWDPGTFHDYRLVPGFEMLSLLFVALLHTDRFGTYPVFLHQVGDPADLTHPAQSSARGIREIRLADLLNRFLAFLYPLPDDQGNLDATDAKDATVESILVPLSDRSETILDCLHKLGNRFSIARAVLLSPDPAWPHTIRQMMHYQCPDDVATIFLLQGAEISTAADVMWALEMAAGRPHIYLDKDRDNSEATQKIETIWMIGSHDGVLTLYVFQTDSLLALSALSLRLVKPDELPWSRIRCYMFAVSSCGMELKFSRAASTWPVERYAAELGNRQCGLKGQLVDVLKVLEPKWERKAFPRVLNEANPFVDFVCECVRCPGLFAREVALRQKGPHDTIWEAAAFQLVVGVSSDLDSLRRNCDTVGLVEGDVHTHYCCFCYEVLWFVQLVEAVNSEEQSAVIPALLALFQFLPIDDTPLFAAIMAYLRALTETNNWIRRSIQSHIFELLAIVLGEDFDQQLGFVATCSAADKKRFALASCGAKIQLSDPTKTSPANLIKRFKLACEGNGAVKEAGLAMSNPKSLHVTAAYRTYTMGHTPQLHLYL
jgi:hypothetical protein